jgi:hypothetical protein
MKFDPAPFNEDATTEDVVDCIVNHLKQLPAFITDLESAWDEICLQLQNGEWDCWGMYDSLITDFSDLATEKAPDDIQLEATQEYVTEKGITDVGEDDIVLDFALRKIADYVRYKALNENNENVERYLYGTDEDDEEEIDKNEKDK